MIVLAIDGALGAFSVAVADGDRVRAQEARTGNVALESGLGMVAGTIARAGISPSGLDRLAVGCGPGGFTGLRIAISYAKALALAWQRPLVAINSFDLLEYGRDLNRVLTIVVGRKGVISARYRAAGVERRASGCIAGVLGALALDRIRPDDGALPVIGAPEDVLGALAERAIEVQAFAPLVMPSATAAALAAQRREPAATVHAVRADYGELPAARIPKST